MTVTSSLPPFLSSSAGMLSVPGTKQDNANRVFYKPTSAKFSSLNSTCAKEI